jgi:hypothetical protein
MLMLFSLQTQAQTVDSTLLKTYPFKIGKIGFAVDSMEFFVRDVKPGENFEHRLGMHNFGKKPVSFTGGKISRFVDMVYEPTVLQPGQSGDAIIKFEVIRELPLGEMHVEVAVHSDDKDSPFKFLYMITNIAEDSAGFAGNVIIDTVPRMVFTKLNHDFGYTWSGKTVIHDFFFTNMGAQDLVIEEIIPSDGCSIIGMPNTVIPPGENGSVVVKVKNWSSFGVQHQTVTIASNDPVNPEITLGLHGNVRHQAPPKQNPDFCYE